MEGSYPGVVELGLDADHVALLLILGAEDVELGGVEGPRTCVLVGFGASVGYLRELEWLSSCTYVSASRASASQGIHVSLLGDPRCWCAAFPGARGGQNKEDLHGSSATILTRGCYIDARVGGRVVCPEAWKEVEELGRR